MPERTRPARAVAALAGGVLVVVLAGPVAIAQTDEVPPSEELDPNQDPPSAPEQPEQPAPPEQEEPGSWGASSYESPFDEADAVLRQETFDIEGTLRYQKTGPSDFIEAVEVRVLDEPSDSSTPGDGCSLPAPVMFSGDGPGAGLVAEHEFHVEGVTLPCNGRYLVEAEGRLEDPDADAYTLRQTFVVAVMPASVTDLDVAFDDSDRSATATFEPLSDADLAPDATGYVLERSGSDGVFVDVATIGLDDDPRIVDPLRDVPAGSYTYRVRAVRAGADGDVRSSVIDTETATVEVEGEPASSSTSTPGVASGRTGTSGARSSGGRIAINRSTSGPRATAPPTTADTGFEDTLDYGEREPGELAGDEALGGQSIVRDEGEPMGLVVPAAGALVMLGWAGHLLYLNRLAKQL